MTRPYHWLAEYYDDVFASARPPIDAARERFIGKLLASAETACDLACGPGNTALDFARRGIRTYAVDLSPGMCRLTRQKARAAGLPVRVIRGDMRDFRLPEPVDLVSCECDAVNHVPHKSDLARVAQSVARALKPGGHFYFDVNNALGFRGYWDRDVWIEIPGVCLTMRNGHDPKASRAWSDIEWFVRDGRHWERHSERVEEICWTAREVRTALRDAGFSRVRAFDGRAFFPGHALITAGCRTVYLAQIKG